MAKKHITDTISSDGPEQFDVSRRGVGKRRASASLPAPDRQTVMVADPLNPIMHVVDVGPKDKVGDQEDWQKGIITGPGF